MVNVIWQLNDYERWIDSKTGMRSDVPHNYIFNKNHGNLQIMSGYHVKRVIFGP